MTPAELAEIRALDARSAPTWFTGPASFTALGARDRRALLHHVDALTAKLREIAGECAECGGSGVILVAVCDQSADFGRTPLPQTCPACADIRALL